LKSSARATDGPVVKTIRSGRRPVAPPAAIMGVRGWAVVLPAVMAGCGGGIHWQGPTFPEARARACRTNQLTFVYFRSWYLVECTDFEERVLKDPAVLSETRDMVCVALDFDWDRPLAQQWELNAVPAFAIVAPNGEVLCRRQAPITRDELLAALRSAKSGFGAATKPVGAARWLSR